MVVEVVVVFGRGPCSLRCCLPGLAGAGGVWHGAVCLVSCLSSICLASVCVCAGVRPGLAWARQGVPRGPFPAGASPSVGLPSSRLVRFGPAYMCPLALWQPPSLGFLLPGELESPGVAYRCGRRHLMEPCSALGRGSQFSSFGRRVEVTFEGDSHYK